MFNYYYDQTTENVVQMIIDNNYYDIEDGDELDDLRDRIYDDAFMDDAVTGNASGSYTFNSYKAKEYVTANTDLLKEALYEFGVDSESISEHFINDDWEYFDVTIRCYVLGACIDDAIEQAKEQLYS